MTSREALFALSLIFKPGEIIVQELLEIYEDPAELYSVLVTGSDSHIPHEMTAKAKAFDLQYASDIYGQGKGENHGGYWAGYQEPGSRTSGVFFAVYEKPCL